MCSTKRGQFPFFVIKCLFYLKWTNFKTIPTLSQKRNSFAILFGAVFSTYFEQRSRWKFENQLISLESFATTVRPVCTRQSFYFSPRVARKHIFGSSWPLCHVQFDSNLLFKVLNIEIQFTETFGCVFTFVLLNY